MALLLQCLRNARIQSGDLDLIPVPDFDEARPLTGGSAELMAREVFCQGAVPPALATASVFAAGSARELAEECSKSGDPLVTART